MSDFSIKQGDRLPVIQATLTDGAGAAIDLTGATAKFLMRSRTSATVVIDASATVVSPATGGVVQYAWGVSDTSTVGNYWGEFEVTFSDGRKSTFPSGTYLSIAIVAGIG